MKKLKTKLLFFVVASTVLLTSCLNSKYEEILYANSTGFDFKTTKDINVSLKTLNSLNQPMQGVIVEFYSQKPFNESGNLIENSANYLVFKGITNNLGELDSKISLATSVDSLSFLVNYIGLPNYHVVKIDSENIDLTIGGSSQKIQQNNTQFKSAKAGIWWVSDFKTVNDFYYYNFWDANGVPVSMSTPNDVIPTDLLADINASLPERIKLTVSHPEYLETEDDGNIELVEDAEVWVTFVHEGAGNLNTLAYYSYSSSNKPASVKDITHPTLIFPNVSYTGSGGGLTSGNKVQLLYYNKSNNQYTNVFPSGTTVAWQLRSGGWSSSSKTVISSNNNFYSDKSFNPESSTSLKKHNVILKDNSRKLLLIGFEDLRRDYSSDEDFNDAVIYATVSPYTAIKNGVYQTIDSPNDNYNDGVSDSNDEYPTDATTAFNNYYPSQFGIGSLAFEDLWPNKGDYDFNDLVVDYNFNQITNAQNKVVEIDAQLTFRAIGASYPNGFGIEFNTTSSNVKSITGLPLDDDLIKRASNGTELNQEKAVIIITDNVYKITPRLGGTANTILGSAYSKPGVINLKIVFNEPISFTTLGTPPYNPFIFVKGVRTKEIHLPGSAPTSLADLSLFGTNDDNSSVATAKYYMSNKYLPWAINFPAKFDYPVEKGNNTLSYLKFNSWVESFGFNNMDWYMNYNGYRDTNLIYTKKYFL
jgi:LruC domain-containing protein